MFWRIDMTKYAEGVRNQYKQWLVKPRKAAEILKERGDIEVAEQILTEINEIENLIEQIHGGMYAPETPADKMHIHFDIIERSALLDVHEKLRPIYAELNRLEREQESKKQVVEPIKEKENKFQMLFGKHKNIKQNSSSEIITSYTDECVKRYGKFKRGSSFDETLINKYYDMFIKPEKDEYMQTFLGLLENLKTKSKEKLLSEQEYAEWILSGIPATAIQTYKRKVEELKKFQTFKPDYNNSIIIRKALLETFYNNHDNDIYEKLGESSTIRGDISHNVQLVLMGNTILKRHIREMFFRSDSKTNGRFFQFANRILYKSPYKEMDLLFIIAENIAELEKSVYIADSEKQQALINLLCDGEDNPKRRKAFELYFQIKDFFEGFKSELPKEYEEAKKQTADSYAYALTEIKNRLAELIKMKQDFYSKTPEEIEKLYGEELIK